MKRIFSSALAILLTITAVQAQTDTTGGLRHERKNMQKERPYAQLNLTAEQQAKLKTAREEFRQKSEALKNEKLTEGERRSQLQALREQQKAATNAVLTPVQKEQLEKMKSERNGNMRGGKRFNSDNSMTRNGRGADLQKELGLTAEQQAKVAAIRADYKRKADELRKEQTATREKLRTLMQQQKEELKSVLTKEQQEKLQSLRQERAARNTR